MEINNIWRLNIMASLYPKRSFKEKYILTSVKSGLLVINIRRAREKILYDMYLKAVSKGGHFSQTALFPVTVQVGADNVFILKEHAELLSSLGFGIGESGPAAITVTALPEGYSAEEAQVEKTVFDLLSLLADSGSMLEDNMNSELASRFAVLGAMNASPVKNTVEAQRLIDDLFSCENPEYTGTGKKTSVIVPTDEIDRKFNL